MFYSSPVSPFTVKSWTTTHITTEISHYIPNNKYICHFYGSFSTEQVITRYWFIFSELMKQEWNK